MPKKCIGFLPNLFRNQRVTRSRYPLKNLLDPNLLFPCLRAWCCTTFSPILVNPAFFANTGIYLCISLYTSMLLARGFEYAFSPQLKSCNFIPETILAVALNNLDGIFFVSLLSYLFFFHPDTKS